MKAHSSQLRPTKREKEAHEEGKGPKRRVWRRLGHRSVFFFNVFFLDVQLIHESPRRPQQPTKADAGPPRGKTAYMYVFLIMYFLFYFSFFILLAGFTSPTTPLFGVADSPKSPRRPQQPTKADAGPRRGKTAHMYVFFNNVFLILFFIFYITSRLHHNHPTPLWRGRQPRKPTKAPAANEGRRRPTKRENGPYVCFF